MPANRLAESLSPYLRQHAHNPVDWYPWGEEALAKSRREEKPIFLSIGYSACHWCHVMERESFENPEIAALLNRHFVAIKVDREERPDLDRVYMKAVQVLTGRGGWPMSVFLAPDLKPFYGGTYFPPEDRHGMPGFRRVVAELARIWQEDRTRILEGAAELTAHLGRESALPRRPLDRAPIRQTVRELAETFDETYGGFGGAPKFPPTGSLDLLLREHARTGEENLLDMALRTLDGMARGGFRDHLGGGFHRYSVDDQWLVPHFEKMLYDNALLAPVYLDAWRVTGEARFREVARGTLDFVLRDLADPGGGFRSTLDADSEGVEGKYYVWSREEIDRILAPPEAELFRRTYGVTDRGNFEGGNILFLPQPAEEQEARLEPARQALLAVRSRRIPPHLDDKVLTAWNGLMLTALAQGYLALGEPRYRAAAEQAAAFLLDTMHTPEGLLRVFRHGQKHTPGFLDDYAYLAKGLLDLFAATGTNRWLAAAESLARTMLAEFADPEGKGFFYTRAEDADLILRERCFLDESLPSPNAVAAEVLLRLAVLTEHEAYREQGEQALAAALAYGERFPTALAHTWCVLDRHLAPATELVLAGDPATAEFQALLAVAGRSYLPRTTLALRPEGQAPIPWLAERAPRHGRPTAHWCREHACAPPITDPDQLREWLENRKDDV